MHITHEKKNYNKIIFSKNIRKFVNQIYLWV